MRKTLFLPAVLLIMLGTLFSIALPVQSSGNAGRVERPGAMPAAEVVTWEQPVNLSKSGAASQPRIIDRGDGHLQVFWWDKFDGLVTSVYDGQQWSVPVSAKIISKNLKKMPLITIDADGWVHAFWMEDVFSGGIDGNFVGLFHTQVFFGRTDWLFPELIANGVTSFEVANMPASGFVVGYIRTKNNDLFPAGMYIRRFSGPRARWDESFMVDSSLYYRLLASSQPYVDIYSDGTTLYVVWENPRTKMYLYATSSDKGLSWSKPEEIKLDQNTGVDPRLLIMAGEPGIVRLWSKQEQGGCSIFMENMPLVGKAALPNGEQSLGARRALAGLASCPNPSSEKFFALNNVNIWLWGEGKSSLTLTGWDPQNHLWSLPLDVRARFTNPETNNMISLEDLHAITSGERLVVTGTEPATGEVWVVRSQTSAFQFAFRPASPWSTPLQVSQPKQGSSQPASVIDKTGNIHIVWTDETGSGDQVALAQKLYYVRSDGTNTTRPSAIVSVSGSEVTREPALFYDAARDRLQMVWSGGIEAGLQYSWSLSGDAGTANGWAAPQAISQKGMPISSPQIAMDDAGKLYILYLVPYNEGRGAYIVYSDNGGESWSAPQRVFDAEAAGWPMINNASLAAAQNGMLQAAWAEYNLPGFGESRGIYFSQSFDTGQTWSEPAIVINEGYDHPQLVVQGTQTHLVFSNQERGTISHRWKDLTQQDIVANAWTIGEDLPRFEGLSGHISLKATATQLHLIVQDTVTGPVYMTWTPGGALGQWTAPERLLSDDQSALIKRIGSDFSAAIQPELGKLIFAWSVLPEQASTAAGTTDTTASTQNTSDQQAGLLVSMREIEKQAAAALPTLPGVVPGVQPTVITEKEVTPTPTIVLSPTPTRDFNAVPPAASTPVPPPVLGAGIAAIAVGGIFAGKIFLKRKRED